MNGQGCGRHRGGNFGPVAASLLIAAGGGVVAAAGPVPDYDFDWVTIRDLNNPPIRRMNDSLLDGRASISYPYRISRYEITTAQWMEFINTFTTQSDDLQHFGAVDFFWGAGIDPTYDGPGVRYALSNHPNAAILPVFGVHWRDAARYCNWLHNGKGSDLASTENGAYDTSTFGDNPDHTITDQLTHNPGARFWIPTWDEWLKAVHYNADGRLWQKWGNPENAQFVSGCPGVGTTSAGAGHCGPGYPFSPLDIPIGAYDTTSFYGLHDVSGGAAEWTEWLANNRYRVIEGNSSASGNGSSDNNMDNIFAAFSTSPWAPGWTSFRVVSVVPCNADLDADGALTFADARAFLDAFASNDHLADWNGDGRFDFFDLAAYLNEFADGCP